MRTACLFSLLVIVVQPLLAQEPVQSEELASQNERAPAASAIAQPDTIEAPTEELTRAERRALRRSERAAHIASEEATDAEGAADDDEGLICRREAVTGSHRRIRICTTRAQRNAMSAASQELLREVTREQGVLGREGH